MSDSSSIQLVLNLLQITIKMRKFMVLVFSLHTMAVPSPADPIKTLWRREEMIPYVIENGCEKYSKMLTAVKAARQLANVAVMEVSVTSHVFATALLTAI